MKTKEKKTSAGLWRGAFLIVMFSLSAFDWPAKPNAEVRADMLNYAVIFREAFKMHPVAATLNRFISSQKEKAEKNPYAWMKDTHELVAKLKESYPATRENQEIRKYILQLLDYPLHVNNLDEKSTKEELTAYNRATYQYLNTTKEALLRQLETIRPTEGIILWKVYNMGFVFRTPQHTIAIDISSNPAFYERNQDGKLLPLSDYAVWKQADYARFINQIDALFLTHPHGDHYSLSLITATLEAGKPVVMPEHLQQLNPVTKEYSSVTRDRENLILLKESIETPINIAGIKVLSFHGYQEKNIPCNIYLLDIDGIRIVHNGDNYDRDQEKKLARYAAANIIIASTWNEVQSILTAAKLAQGAAEAHQIFIPSHENELGHTVDHRESYHEMFSRKDRLGNPEFEYPRTVLLDTGESYSYKK